MQKNYKVNVDIWPNISDQKNPNLENSYKLIKKSNNYTINYLSIKSIFKRFDIIHIHWPEYFISGSIFRYFILFLFFKLAIMKHKNFGGKIVWTIHNITPHDENLHRRYNKLMNFFLEKIDGFICMNKSTINRLQNKFNAELSAKKVFYSET